MGKAEAVIERRECGPNGLVISHLGLGGAALGRAEEPSGVGISDEEGAQTLAAAYSIGVHHVDTSPAYGQSERRIGIALRRNRFEGLTLSTKVGTHPERRFSYAGADVRWSLENSLAVLGTDYVDIALIHDPPDIEPVLASGDGFDALKALRAEGLCRNVGLGVHSHHFHRRAIEAGAVDVILTYGDFNIVRRSGASLMRYARQHGVGVLLGSPMMHGLLAAGTSPESVVNTRPVLFTWYDRADIARAQEWWEWCREREVSMRHLNMCFVMSSDLPDCVLTGAQTSSEVATNVREATSGVDESILREAMDRIAIQDEEDEKRE